MTGRVYGGRTSAERRAERRERLLDAGLDLFGTLGWAAASVERLCAAASVATRSFYEEFASREALLLDVYATIVDGVTAEVAGALEAVPPTLESRVTAGIEAYVRFITADVRRARIVHREVRIAGVLETQRRAAFLSFALLVEREAQELQRREAAGRLTALALTGALNEVLIDWVEVSPRGPVEPIIEELTAIFTRTLRA